MTDRKLNALVVDDEPAIAQLVEACLRHTNLWNVVFFTDSRDALEHYRKNYMSIDAVITDMMMPYLDGYELYKGVKSINPDAHVILMTGSYDEDKLAELQEKDRVSLFRKPFEMEDFRMFFTNFANITLEQK